MNKFDITIGPVLEPEIGHVLTKVLKFAPLVGIHPCVKRQKVSYYRKGKIMENDKRKMLELRKAGKTHKEISTVIKCSDETIRRHLAIMGVD